MPSPVLIVCSEGGSVDRHTNQLSIFDVIEKLTFRQLEPGDVATSTDGRSSISEMSFGGRLTAINAMRVTTVWKRSECDKDREFEFKTTLMMPGAGEAVVISEGRFVFKSLLHRLVAQLFTDMPNQSGNIVVKSLIRPVGDADWISQEYVIPVERIELCANQPNLPLS